MSIADFFFGRKQNSSNKRRSASRTRNLRMEALEERALLSVTPLSPDEYSALSAQYAQFHLPEDMSDLNVITLDLAEGDGLAELKSAIETAGSTDESDLIVVRTSDDANTITFTSNSDELLININASSKGAITIVGLGTKPLTLDAAQQCRVITVSGTNDDAITVANLGGLTITNGISANSVERTDFGGGIYCQYGTLMAANCAFSENTAASGGIFNDRGTLTVINSTISGNTATQSADSGDGIYNDEEAQGATINNSIVIDGIKNQSTISGSNNLSVFSDWTSGSDNVDYDSTKPLFVDAANDDYRLIKDSQAIDKGNNALAVDANGQPLVYDLDDCSRFINNIVDFGAYEYSSQLSAPTLSASTAGSDSITVTVGEVEHATGYTVEYSTSSDFADSTIQNVSAGNTTISDLNANTKYYFRAMALGGGVYTDSDYSQTASATTDRMELPPPNSERFDSRFLLRQGYGWRSSARHWIYD